MIAVYILQIQAIVEANLIRCNVNRNFVCVYWREQPCPIRVWRVSTLRVFKVNIHRHTSQILWPIGILMLCLDAACSTIFGLHGWASKDNSTWET